VTFSHFRWPDKMLSGRRDVIIKEGGSSHPFLSAHSRKEGDVKLDHKFPGGSFYHGGN